ncbi:uncharacterized protein LOC109710751 [Ananas comosus]|uniref:Uncharacterized protein LOC109710751 n=1 Tax=Ananas comosus TaxID=4615 RepID=A0A6P5F015_ANACO|nr:uncharacterized protein LOC109710751 [Ananas comosus]
MASTFYSHLQSYWPFSIFKTDDLKISARLVRKLSIPEATKEFVFAVHEPDSKSVVYILAAQNLSHQSALDAEYLIKEVQPKAVIVQVAPSALPDIQSEEKCLKDGRANNVPASAFEVLKKSFYEKMNKEQYEKLAGCQVLQEIFGIGFYGHFLSAKRAAEEINSCFLLLESPYESACSETHPNDAKSEDASTGLYLQTNFFVPHPGKAASAVSSNFKRLCFTDPLQLRKVKSLAPSLDLLAMETASSNYVSEQKPEECKPMEVYEAPPFAQSVYPLLSDLYNIFIDLPSMGKALFSAQTMLARINEGEPVDAQILSDVYAFRIAIEGLRIALNNAARSHIDKVENGSSPKLDFNALPHEDKCHALFAEALKSQARKSGSVVAIVDASCLSGIRRHWNTHLPLEVAGFADSCFANYDYKTNDDHHSNDGKLMQNTDKRGLLADNPVVAVGAGATVILGASSLSKAVHASTLFKLAAYKVPVALKYSLTQLQRTAAIGLSKILAPSKLISPGIASAGAKSSALKFTASAEKIRAVTHTVVASAERTSLLAMRTAFYEIMQRRRTQPVRFAPWLTFGCSVGACAGLLLHEDAIECVAESIPAVPTIVSLGRGLQSLRDTSLEVRGTSGTKIQEALQSLMYNLKKMKVQ